tara:strand:+ start:139 stop:474 length:336 start_codon:yes stop_codon:yes gene_type:complete
MVIQYTNWGIAYAYDNVIEINKKLKMYPKLKKMILEHEREHIKNPSFLSTLWIDFKDMFDFEKHFLMKKHLSWKIRLQSLAPVWYHKGNLNYNMFSIVLYSLIISMFFIVL